MTTFLRHVIWPAFALLVALTLITGAAYPAVVTAIAQVAFPRQANGSMIVVDGQTVGSSLIGQALRATPKYFWGRPSRGAEQPTATTQAARPARTWARRARQLIDRITAAGRRAARRPTATGQSRSTS